MFISKNIMLTGRGRAPFCRWQAFKQSTGFTLSRVAKKHAIRSSGNNNSVAQGLLWTPPDHPGKNSRRGKRGEKLIPLDKTWLLRKFKRPLQVVRLSDGKVQVFGLPPTRLIIICMGASSSWAAALCIELAQLNLRKTTGAWRSIAQIPVCADTLTRGDFSLWVVTQQKKQVGEGHWNIVFSIQVFWEIKAFFLKYRLLSKGSTQLSAKNSFDYFTKFMFSSSDLKPCCTVPADSYTHNFSDNCTVFVVLPVYTTTVDFIQSIYDWTADFQL